MEVGTAEILHCLRCNKYKAKKNCQTCSKPICLKCCKVSAMRLSASGSLKNASDYKFIDRCIECDTSNESPEIVNADLDRVCFIQ